MERLSYQPIPELSSAEVEAALSRDSAEELLIAAVSVGLYAEDLDWAASVCCRLAVHPHPNVRGNALLSFGHLARRFRRLDRGRTLPLIVDGLGDPDPFVRGQADAAADDVEHFLGWRFRATPILDWHAGQSVPGVAYQLNDVVEITEEWYHAGARGAAIGLVVIDPEPKYLVELRSEEVVEVPQRALRPVA